MFFLNKFKSGFIQTILGINPKDRFLFFFYVIIIIILLLDISHAINIFNFSYTDLSSSNYILEGHASPEPQDPVRYWPSGVPQSFSIVGVGLATFAALSKIPNCSPRLRVLGSLGAAGVGVTTVVYQGAINNPTGFNRFMYGASQMVKTGTWPSLEQIHSIPDNKVNEFANKAIGNLSPHDRELVNEAVAEVLKRLDKGSNFLPTDFTSFYNKSLDFIFNLISPFLKSVPVEGYLDDLIGQQIIIEMLLLVLVFSLILLFIFFIINIIFILNKDKILNKFENKFVKFYIKYQALLAKLTLIYVPILILMGLFTLAHGIHFILTHQIPYDSLGVDLHNYIFPKK